MSVSQWLSWCDSIGDERGGYDEGFGAGCKQPSEVKYTEQDLTEAEEKGYKQAVADIKDEIKQNCRDISDAVECILDTVDL